MDENQERKKQARLLEQKGDERGALALYLALAEESRDPGLLARAGTLQARLGDEAAAVAAFTRGVELLEDAGLPNAAVSLHRRLARLVPGRPETHLEIAALSAPQGYLNDAREALRAWLAQGGPGAPARAAELIGDLPPESRTRLAADLADELLEADPTLAAALGDLQADAVPAEPGPLSGLPRGPEPEPEPQPEPEPLVDREEGLQPTVYEEPAGPLEVPPIEGLETHGLEALEAEPAVPPLPALESTAGPVDLGPAPEPEEEDEGPVEDLPLLGFGIDTPAEPAPTGPVGEGEVHDWVDLGALVLSEDGEPVVQPDLEERPGAAADAEEDFSELLLELGVGGASRATAEDLGSAYDLGVAYKEMGMMDEAIAQLQTALVGSGNPLATLEVLGECYLERGDAERACAVLRRAEGLRSAGEGELLGVRYLLGRCEEALGRADRARREYERVLESDPDFRDAADRLDRL